MSEIGIHISVPCGPEGAVILGALAKALGAPNPNLTAAQDHMAHTAAVNTHMLPAAAPVAPPAPPVTPQPPAQVIPPPAGVPTAAPDYTHEQLGRAASAYLDKSPANMAQLRGLLQQFGVQAITQLDTPEQRTAFAGALRGLGVQI